MIEAYKKFWKGYVDFKGRSTRSDYWLNVLEQCLVYLLFSFLLILIMILGGDSSTYTSDPYSFQMILVYIVVLGIGVYALASLVPSIAIIVRRLRDAGLPLGLDIPIANSISWWFYYFYLNLTTNKGRSSV